MVNINYSFDAQKFQLRRVVTDDNDNELENESISDKSRIADAIKHDPQLVDTVIQFMKNNHPSLFGDVDKLNLEEFADRSQMLVEIRKVMVVFMNTPEGKEYLDKSNNEEESS